MKNKILVLITFLLIILVSLTAIPLISCNSKITKKLDVYVWEGYLSEEISNLFEEETGIELNVIFMSDNETMRTFLQGGGRADITMPTDPHIFNFYENDLVQPIDIKNISNFNNVSKSFREQPWVKWDGKQTGSGDTYAVPYVFGTNGIVINTSKYTKSLEDIGWDILFDADLKGRVSVNENYTFVYLILDMLGIPKEEFVSNTQKTLDSIRNEAIELKNNSLKFHDTNVEIVDLLKNEEVWVSYINDGTGRKLEQFDPKFKYILPRTGGFAWADAFMIPKNAANYEGAISFIDFLLRPDIAAMVTDCSGFSTTIEGALDLTKNIDKELYKFTDEEMARLQWLPSVSSEAMSIFVMFREELSTQN